MHRPIALSSHGRMTFVSPRDIVYVESNRRKLHVHTTDRVIDVYGTLEGLACDLPAGFVQSHKSFLVNMDFVEASDAGGLRLRGGQTVPVSQLVVVTFLLWSAATYGLSPVMKALVVGAGIACAIADLALFRALRLSDECRMADWRARLLEEQVDLCALFSNLLDNAIQACERAEGVRFVRIRSRVVAGQLVVDVENSCVAGGGEGGRRADRGGATHMDSLARRVVVPRHAMPSPAHLLTMTACDVAP